MSACHSYGMNLASACRRVGLKWSLRGLRVVATDAKDDPDLQARRLRLKVALEDLKEMRGFGTELVTVVIPPDRQISDVRGHLQNEHGQAANIKSKGTRKNVQGAIESALSSLNRHRSAGERGLAIFVGAVIVGNNKTRMVNITIDDPPEAFASFRYRCDSTFEVTQLEEMLIDRNSYGLFVIDRSEAAFGLASGKRLHVQEHIYSQVPSKHGRGGQSAQRFERLIEEAAHNFFKKATEHASNYWLPMVQDIRAIIIGGPGATKEFVLRNEYFHHEIAKRIASTTFDVGYSNESGLRELLDNAGPMMGEIELDAERQLMNAFLKELVQAHPKATYGEQMIRTALEQGAVDTLLISESLRKTSFQLECNSCGHGWTVTLDRHASMPACPSCDQPEPSSVKEAPLIEELSAMAARSSSKVAFISIDTEEGATLMHGFGGVAALLRYPM